MLWGLHLHTDHGRDTFVFPSTTHRDREISENTLNAALRRMGYDTKRQHCSHGFRKTASALLNAARFDPEVIEWQLAHVDKDRMRGTYNKATLLPERIELMQRWSDMLDELRAR
jgi:hypothetical protein